MNCGFHCHVMGWPTGQPDSSGYLSATSGVSYNPKCVDWLQDQLNFAINTRSPQIRCELTLASFCPTTPGVYDYHTRLGPIVTFVAQSSAKLLLLLAYDAPQVAAWKALNGGLAWTALRPPSGLWPSIKAAYQEAIDYARSVWSANGRSLTDGSLSFSAWNEPEEAGGPQPGGGFNASGHAWSYTGNWGISFHDVLQGCFGGLNLHGHPWWGPTISLYEGAPVTSIVNDIVSLSPASYPVYGEFTGMPVNLYTNMNNAPGRFGVNEFRDRMAAQAILFRDTMRGAAKFGLNTKALAVHECMGRMSNLRGSLPASYQDQAAYILAGLEAIEAAGCYEYACVYACANGSANEDTIGVGFHRYAAREWTWGALTYAQGRGYNGYSIADSPPSGTWASPASGVEHTPL